jgi:hypothetical protein
MKVSTKLIIFAFPEIYTFPQFTPSFINPQKSVIKELHCIGRLIASEMRFLRSMAANATRERAQGMEN